MGGDGGRGVYPGNPPPTSIRKVTRYSEENQANITTLFKISYISNGMYDIIEPALAIRAWQCRGSGD